MKKSYLLIFSVLSLVFAISCGKESKPTPHAGCPPIQCEFGMDSATCKCLPDPNDTTGNGNGGNDTTTAPVLRSKFGNGSNGTVDTTQNWALDKTFDYWTENDYYNFRITFGGYGWIPTNNFEVEIDGVLRDNLTSLDIPGAITCNSGFSTTPNGHTEFGFRYMMLDIDSSLASNTYDLGFSVGSPCYLLFDQNIQPEFKVYDAATNIFNFQYAHSSGHIILDNTNPFEEFTCKFQLLNFSATDRRLYMRAYIKYEGVRYVVRAELKKDN